MVKEFISEYGMTILYTVLASIAGFIGLQLKKLYEKCVNEDVKERVVKDCVKAVEQLYKDLSGEEKKAKAIENIVAILDSKGITVAPIEIEILIESALAEFNDAFGKGEEDE